MKPLAEILEIVQAKRDDLEASMDLLLDVDSALSSAWFGFSALLDSAVDRETGERP